MNEAWKTFPNALTHARTLRCTVVDEFNRSSKSVISTTLARSEELLELLIELGMLEHTHTYDHAPTHTPLRQQTPVQVTTPVFVCLLYAQVLCSAAGLHVGSETWMVVFIVSRHVACPSHHSQHTFALILTAMHNC